MPHFYCVSRHKRLEDVHLPSQSRQVKVHYVVVDGLRLVARGLTRPREEVGSRPGRQWYEASSSAGEEGERSLSNQVVEMVRTLQA